MNLLCESTWRVRMIPIAFFVTGFISQILTPLQVKFLGMRNSIIATTLIQALMTPLIFVTKTLYGAIVLYSFLGATGSRTAFSYLYLTQLIPETHVSFVSLWLIGSLGLSILFTDAYFFFYPQQIYYQVFVTMLGLCITVGSA